MQGIEIPIGAPLGQLDRDLKGAEKKLKGFTSSAESDLKGFSSTASTAFKSAGIALAGAFSVGAFISFGKDVLAVTAEFEKFGAVLGNTLGSDALAKLKLKEIEEFAAKTPFSVQELTDSFIKLANQGFKPTAAQMLSLGDLAASTGKSFNQLAEAIIDAQTGELERLKEFGIISQQSGDKVIFTFKGVQTTVDKSSEAIRNYITSLGNLEGVTGATAVISETLTGKISNLGDSWNQMLVSIGSNTSGVFSSVISIISEAVTSITEFNKELNIASKFKIEGTLIDGLVKSVGKITGIPALGAFMSTKDIKVNAIQSVEKGVNNIVSATLSGAKSANDFGTAIARLKAEGDKLLQSKGGGDKQVAAAFQSIYQDGIKALQDGRKQFQAELAKPAAASFGKAKKEKEDNTVKSAKDKADKLKAEAGKFNQEMMSSLMNFEANAALAAKEAKAKLNIIDPEALELAVSQSEVAAKEIVDKFAAIKAPLLTPFQNLNLYIKDNIIPQLSTSFKTFFDDFLMNGTLSFDKLGQAIKNTFLSVLASEATKGVMNLLVGGGKGENGKGGGLISGVLGLVGGGGKGGGGGGLLKSIGGLFGAGAAATGGAGGAGALAAGTAATGGALLPILAGVAAVASIASLFKKKPQAPLPQASSTISTSAAGSSQNFGGGAVVFEISGTNLIGVLNRAGAKLTRFGP
jgi:hypothetical protein